MYSQRGRRNINVMDKINNKIRFIEYLTEIKKFSSIDIKSTKKDNYIKIAIDNEIIDLWVLTGKFRQIGKKDYNCGLGNLKLLVKKLLKEKEDEN